MLFMSTDMWFSGYGYIIIIIILLIDTYMALFKEHSALQNNWQKWSKTKSTTKHLTFVQMCCQQMFENRHRDRLPQLNW